MLRKTAAIAVLILVVSSFALGSVGQVQAVAETRSGQGKVVHYVTADDRAELPPAKAQAGTWHTQFADSGNTPGSSTEMPDAGAGIPSGVSFVTVVNGEMMSGVVREDAPLPLPGDDVTSIVLYMNELQLERPAFTSYAFTVAGNGPPPGAMLVIPARLPDKPYYDNLSIKGKMAMTKPGAEPEYYDFKWEKRGAMPEENGTFARFSGHMSIPASNFSAGKTMMIGAASGYPAGDIEINSDLMVDMASLQGPATVKQANATYNNHIAAGDSIWHVASVSSSVKSMNVDLKWSNPDGKLRLMVYTPDGKVLGPYYDDSDGKTDGRINLNIANPSGVAAGEWHLKVTDTDTLGDNDYYVKTY